MTGDIWRSPDGAMELRCGRWQDVLSDVVECDAVITDPPYSPKVHAGYRTHDDMVAAQRRSLLSNRASGRRMSDGQLCHGRPSYGSVGYKPLEHSDAEALAYFCGTSGAGWCVAFGDHKTQRMWESVFEAAGWLVFAPLAWFRTGGTPRFQGDGPACSVEWITVSRPRRLTRCGSLPGYYVHDLVKGNSPEKIVTGGKPVGLMRQIIRDYSHPGDLIVDPYAGGGTTLLAAAIEGRRAIGAECDPDTYAKAVKRLSAGYTPRLL